MNVTQGKEVPLARPSVQHNVVVFANTLAGASYWNKKSEENAASSSAVAVKAELRCRLRATLRPHRRPSTSLHTLKSPPHTLYTADICTLMSLPYLSHFFAIS